MESMNTLSKDQEQERCSFSTSIGPRELVGAIRQEKEMKTHRWKRRNRVNSVHRYHNCLRRKSHGEKILTTNGVSSQVTNKPRQMCFYKSSTGDGK